MPTAFISWLFVKLCYANIEGKCWQCKGMWSLSATKTPCHHISQGITTVEPAVHLPPYRVPLNNPVQHKLVHISLRHEMSKFKCGMCPDQEARVGGCHSSQFLWLFSYFFGLIQQEIGQGDHAALGLSVGNREDVHSLRCTSPVCLRGCGRKQGMAAARSSPVRCGKVHPVARVPCSSHHGRSPVFLVISSLTWAYGTL